MTGALITNTEVAWGEPELGSGAGLSLSARQQSLRVIALSSKGDALPEAELRAALERELGRPVQVVDGEAPAGAAGLLTITYRRSAGELAVTWDSAEQASISRVISAPERTAEVIRQSVLLAGNLARSQVEAFQPAPAPAPIPVAPTTSPQQDTQREPRIPVSASLFFPLATHNTQRAATSYLDFNLLYGRIGGVDGLQLGLVNVVTPEAGRGSGTLKGLQLGALANIVSHDSAGIQVALVYNRSGGASEGLQLALAGNSSASGIDGVQTALGFNHAGSKLEGLQLALVNIARDVDGAQIGLVNVAGKVRGASIGLVNIADDIDGLPLAPFSVTRTGGVHASAWSGTSGIANVGAKFATRHTYSLFFAAYHRAFEREFWGGGLALGGRIDLSSEFKADFDAAGTYLVAPATAQDAGGSEYHEQIVQPRLRALLGYRAAAHVGAFVGGAALLQIRSREGWDRVTVAVGPELFGGVEL